MRASRDAATPPPYPEPMTMASYRDAAQETVTASLDMKLAGEICFGRHMSRSCYQLQSIHHEWFTAARWKTCPLPGENNLVETGVKSGAIGRVAKMPVRSPKRLQ
jgi:hypothetical protein